MVLFCEYFDVKSVVFMVFVVVVYDVMVLVFNVGSVLKFLLVRFFVLNVLYFVVWMIDVSILSVFLLVNICVRVLFRFGNWLVNKFVILKFVCEVWVWYCFCRFVRRIGELVRVRMKLGVGVVFLRI